MAVKFANLASSTLASSLSSTATSISVTSSSSFPTLGSGDYFYASIGEGTGSEIVKVTGVSSNTFTVVRGQDGTSGQSWSSGSTIALRVVAAALDDIAEQAQTAADTESVSIDGDTMTGNLTISNSSSPKITLTDTTNTTSLLIYSQNSDSIIGTYSNHPLKLFSNSNLALTLDTSGDATFAGTVTWTGGGSANANTAYGWGNHASQGYITNATASLDAAKITSGTFDSARIPRPVSGDWWNNGYVRVLTDGVMEVGKYLDFHTSDSGTTDFDVRVTATPGAIDIDGDLTVDDITAGAITSSGGGSFAANTSITNARLTITDNTDALRLRSTTNGVGVNINFSDHAGGSYAQAGNINYVHADSVSYGSGHAFILTGTEANMTVLADGKLMFKEGLYVKPSSGTGAGTQVIDSSRNATLGSIASGTITSTGNSVFTGSGSSGNAFNVLRGSDSTSALRVMNTGEVLVSKNYLYVNSPQGAYFQNAIRARGGITNDGGNDLSISSGSTNITFNNKHLTSVGAITATSYSGSLVSSVTATTQTASDNSTKVATTAYVTTAVDNIVSAAPGSLDTLNELAAALGDDANFSTTVTNSIATKLPLAGGTMSGTINSRDVKPQAGYHYLRSDHHSGHLEGSYNNVGANGLKSNPIYTIGTSYNPTDAALGNMYGIGYCSTSSSFANPQTGSYNWGMYVAADGDARVWLDGSTGAIWSVDQHYVGANVVWNAGNDGPNSGLDADTLDGSHASAFLGVSGTAANSQLLDSIDSTGFMRTGRELTTIDTISNGGDRYNPSTNNPTNEHYAVLTYGNGSNVTGQLATHFQSGATYNRAYNNSWSAWSRMFDDDYHPNADKWTTARSHTVTLTGDVTGSATQSVDGTGNKTWTLSTAVGDDSHFHHRLDSTDDRDVKPNTTGIATSVQALKPFFTSFGGMTGTDNTTYLDMLAFDTYADSSGGGPSALSFHKGASAGDPKMYIWKAGWNATTWSTGQRVFADNYHPNADKWTTARTITLSGDLNGSVSLDGSTNVTLSAQVVNDSHNHSNYVVKTGDTMTGQLTLSGTSPQLKFNDTTSGADDFWIHVNSDTFYILTDRDDSGSWDGTYPLQLNNSNSRGFLYGQRIFAENYHPNADTLTTARTINGVSFDGSANITVADSTKLPLAGGTMSGTINSRDVKPQAGYHLQRSDHHSGHLEGSYNNIAANGSKTNPIYTIGSSYNPNESALNNMYGVGFARANQASFVSLTGASSWGLYVASAGTARVFLDGETGSVTSTGQHYVGANVVWNAGNDGTGSGLDADTVDSIHAASFLRSDATDFFTGQLTMSTQKALIASNYGHGVYGLYSPSRYQHVWSMGTSYNAAANGASTGSVGNLYGLAWTYNPDHGAAGNNAQAKAGLNHQLLLTMNGITKTALGDGIWTSGNISRNGNTVWDAGNDGTGSGLDADTVDTIQANRILFGTDTSKVTRYNGDWDTMFGVVNTGFFDNSSGTNGNPDNFTHHHGFQVRHNNLSNEWGYQFMGSYHPSYQSLWHRSVNAGTWTGWKEVWDSGNDGPGSGLDADTLDGEQGSYYFSPVNFPTRTNFENSYSNLSTSTGDSANLNTTFQNQKSGFFDVWGGTAGSNNKPPGTTHVQGVQVRHSTGNHYGWQIASQYSQQALWKRTVTNNSFGSWDQIWTAGTDGTGSGLDADTVDGKHRQEISRYQSTSNFVDGTLVTTNINSGNTNGDSFVIEISGKAYGSSRPHFVVAEGYIYNNTIINTEGSNIGGSNFTYLKVMNISGNLCFWFPRHGYWNSYDVFVRSSSAGTSNHNRVTAIANSADPSSATKKIQINLVTSWTSANDGTGSGLDADTVDSYHVSTTRNSANTIPVRDGNGYLNVGWINTTSGARTTQAITRVYASDDNYVRYYSLANFGSQIASHVNYNSLQNKPTIPTNNNQLTNGAGYLTNANDRIYITDTRGANRAPSYYDDRYVQADFSQSVYFGVSGGDSWGAALTVSKWSSYDSSHRQEQLIFAGTKLARRVATSDSAWSSAHTIWDSSTDGTGSGLDADTVDSIQGSSLLRSDVADSVTGTLTFQTNIRRNAHNVGFLEGGHNNVGSTAAKTSPIFTIGSSYNPAATTLGNMYGVGFGHNGNGSFLTSVSALTQGTTGWGMYVASDGDARIFLNSEKGIILSTGQHYAAGSLVWNAGNDGSGSGLDADTLHTLAPKDTGGTGANQILRSNGNNYFVHNSWIAVGLSGLYSGTNGAHFYPSTSTYGSWRINGSRGGYTGIWLDYSNVNIGMYDSGGNGGDYSSSATGGWHYYYHRANSCMGIGGSTTSSSYGLYEQRGGIYSTGNITAYSDRRIKENIVPIDNALEKVNQLEGVYYSRIDDPDKKREIGFIAQDVNEVTPELVTYAEDIDQYGVKYQNTTALLVEAVKTLTQQVKDLQAEIEEMKNA